MSDKVKDKFVLSTKDRIAATEHWIERFERALRPAKNRYLLAKAEYDGIESQLADLKSQLSDLKQKKVNEDSVTQTM